MSQITHKKNVSCSIERKSKINPRFYAANKVAPKLENKDSMPEFVNAILSKLKRRDLKVEGRKEGQNRSRNIFHGENTEGKSKGYYKERLFLSQNRRALVNTSLMHYVMPKSPPKIGDTSTYHKKVDLSLMPIQKLSARIKDEGREFASYVSYKSKKDPYFKDHCKRSITPAEEKVRAQSIEEFMNL